LTATEKNQRFQKIYHDNYSLLTRIVFRITGRQDISEEVVQEAFIKYYERVETLPQDDSVRYWLIRVVKNLSYNHEKRRGREKKAYEKFSHQPSREQGPEGERSVFEAETKEAVQKALMELPYHMRIVLILKEYGGFNYHEIAQMLQISEGNVKVRAFRARSQLSNIIEKGEYYAP